MKRAGTGAWKWINAEDVQINENQPPIGHTFFQRSDTYKRMNKQPESNLATQERRMEEGTSSKSPLSQGAIPQYDSSETLNNERFYEIQRQQQLIKQQKEQERQFEEGDIDNAMEHEMSQGTRRKLERTKEKEENRKSKVPKALFDPEVRKQLEELKQHKPYFMYTITFIQIFMMFLSVLINYKYTGSLIENINTNVMIGPSSGPLLHLGARFVPCMKQMSEGLSQRYNVTLCPKGVNGSISPNNYQDAQHNVLTENLCSLSDLCGLGGFDENEKPNQWARFILPIFLHAGFVHLFINLLFQIRTGIQMERDFGTWRIMIIYMLSGIFGFAFGADINYAVISVGCSGALYGLVACLLLDLIQNWKLIVNPWMELLKMTLIIVFSLGIGLLPYVDNFAHVGGFITGILTGLIFMPTIIFGKWDLRRKRLLKVVSVPILIGIFIWVFSNFYSIDPSTCTWCKYVSCIPINNWCDSYIQSTD